MKKNNNKIISKEEKLEFYIKYTDKKLQENMQKTEEKLFKIGLLSIKIFLAIGLIGMLFTPWIVFAIIPGFVIPLITIAISNSKRKRTIESLTENITYEDFLKMKETGEWTKIAYDIHFNQTIDLDNNHEQLLSKNHSSQNKIESENNNDLSI